MHRRVSDLTSEVTDTRWPRRARMALLGLALIAVLNGLYRAFIGQGAGVAVRVVLVLIFSACFLGFVRFAVQARSGPPSLASWHRQVRTFQMPNRCWSGVRMVDRLLPVVPHGIGNLSSPG